MNQKLKRLEIQQNLRSSMYVGEVQAVYKKQEIAKLFHKILNSKDCYDFIMDRVNIEELNLYEQCWIVYLNRTNHVLGYTILSKGGLAGCVVDSRIAFSLAHLLAASSIVLIHNHPSMQLKPSQADINITQEIVQSGKLLHIEVLDHLIINPEAYYSFADEGML